MMIVIGIAAIWGAGFGLGWAARASRDDWRNLTDWKREAWK